MTETVGPGAAGGATGSVAAVGPRSREGASLLARGGGLAIGGGGVGAVGNSQPTIGPVGGGISSGLRTGTSSARARAAPWAPIDRGRRAARRPKRPAGGADTTRSSKSLLFIVASVYCIRHRRRAEVPWRESRSEAVPGVLTWRLTKRLEGTELAAKRGASNRNWFASRFRVCGQAGIIFELQFSRSDLAERE